MLLNCTNKGCYANDEHKLDLNEDKVICDHCGKEITVPETTKRTLKSLNQVRKKPKTGIQITCKTCGHTDKPVLSQQPNSTIATCRKCYAKLDIHPSFVNAMREMGGEYFKTETPPPTKATPAPKAATKTQLPPPTPTPTPPPVTVPKSRKKAK